MFALSGTAWAAERVALVIGNTAYEHTRVLPNGRNDARAIAGVLKRIGFEVTETGDLGYRAMRETIRAFGRAAETAEVVVVYYAGHGLEVAGENYLVPVDAKVLSDTDLEYESVTLASLLDTMRAKRKLSLIILDACRNNPLSDRIQLRTGITRSVSRGLARVEPAGDILVAFAARAGTLAQDGTGANSPYAAALIAHLPTPGLDVRLVMGRVRDMVLASTTPPQEPYIYGSLGGSNIPLVPEAEPPPRPAAAGSGDTKVPTAEQEAAAAWSPAPRTAEPQVAIVALPPPPPPPPTCTGVEVDVVGTGKRCLDPVDAKNREFQDCRDGTCAPQMVVVPAGKFLMGSPASEKDRSRDEGPQHEVTIAKPFAVGKFEVTFDEWDACVGDGGCGKKRYDAGWGRGKRPVFVTWNDVTSEYLPWLNRKLGLSGAAAYRLLTEAEWEYAARAGTTTPFSTGPTITTDQANFDGNATYGGSAKGVYRKKTVEVGSFKPNAFGLHDMHGNMWEWVQDCYVDSYKGAPIDGTKAVESAGCQYRVVRGGSLRVNPQGLRSALRYRYFPDGSYDLQGFRVGRSFVR